MDAYGTSMHRRFLRYVGASIIVLSCISASWSGEKASEYEGIGRPATDEEIRASALQFVRKLSGFTRPAKANEVVFNRAIDRVTEAAHELLESLVTNAPPKDREVEAAKARARSADRFRSAIAEQGS